jgi:hypothetical protein
MKNQRGRLNANVVFRPIFDASLLKRRLRELPAKISNRRYREPDVFEYIYLDISAWI